MGSGPRMLVAHRARTSGLLERGHLVRTGIADVPSARRASCPPLTLFDLLRSPRTPGKMPGGRAGCPRTRCGRDVRAPKGRCRNAYKEQGRGSHPKEAHNQQVRTDLRTDAARPALPWSDLRTVFRSHHADKASDSFWPPHRSKRFTTLRGKLW